MRQCDGDVQRIGSAQPDVVTVGEPGGGFEGICGDRYRAKAGRAQKLPFRQNVVAFFDSDVAAPDLDR